MSTGETEHVGGRVLMPLFRVCALQPTLGVLSVTNQVCPEKNKLGREKA